MSRDKQPFRALLDTATAGDEWRSQAAALLEPLREYDSAHSGDLVQTLAVYFQLGGNASRTAERLFLHRNGLLYRLSRIEEILGAPLDDAEVRMALELALRERGGKKP